MKRPLTFTMFILVIFVTQSHLNADSNKTSKNPHLLQTRTKSVSVFKNGLGFFMREGTAVRRDGWVMAERIPPAKFGTLAIYSHNEKEMVDVVGSGPGEVVEFDGVDADDSLVERQKRLRAAEKLKVQLFYEENGSQRTAAGTIVSAEEQFAILDTGTQSIAVPIATVSKMQILAMPLRIHIDVEKGNDSEEAKLGIAYLSGGITWIPEYSVKILDEENAELTLRGILVNEAEDLIHCDVNFVVGVPHFTHTNYMAPIAVGQIIRTIGTAVAPQPLQSQIMNRGAIVSNYNTSDQSKVTTVVEKSVTDGPGNLKAATGNLPQVNSAGGSDYTVYTKKDLTVRKGEKAIVTLFTQKIKYTHIYRWSPPSRIRHLLQLHNDGETAWTTGTYLAVSGGSPLSEDLLKYTPKGGCGEIPVTAAINIATNKRENETDRELKAYQPDKYKFWDFVTLTGELRLRNFEKRLVEVVLEVPVPGKPTKASDEGVLAMDSTKLKLLERAGTVSWTIKLEPGEGKTLTYSYQRYIPTQ